MENYLVAPTSPVVTTSAEYIKGFADGVFAQVCQPLDDRVLSEQYLTGYIHGQNERRQAAWAPNHSR